MTPSRIEPTTFRFVAQCLQQLRHRLPLAIRDSIHWLQKDHVVQVTYFRTSHVTEPYPTPSCWVLSACSLSLRWLGSFHTNRRSRRVIRSQEMCPVVALQLAACWFLSVHASCYHSFCCVCLPAKRKFGLVQATERSCRLWQYHFPDFEFCHLYRLS